MERHSNRPSQGTPIVVEVPVEQRPWKITFAEILGALDENVAEHARQSRAAVRMGPIERHRRVRNVRRLAAALRSELAALGID